MKPSKCLAIGALLLLSVACGAAAAPTPEPTATPAPTLTVAAEATATPRSALTPTPEPTAASLPAPTSMPEPTVIPTIATVGESPAEEAEEYTSALNAVFPEISGKMKDIRPVYTAYFHSGDWQAPGENTTVNEVFKLLKMENIASHEGYQEVSPALVVEHEPDLIIADSIESVVGNPDLAGLHMVKDTAHIPHHIFVMKEGYSFYVADPGFRDTVAAFAAFAYPDTFTFNEGAIDDHGAGHDESGSDHDGGREGVGGDHGEGHDEAGSDHDGGHGDGHSHSH